MPNRQGFKLTEFPALYEAQHRSYQEDVPFWIDLARQAGTPFLELGCGSGRVFIPLLKEGLYGVGLDRDLEMLKLLRRKQPADVFCADMTTFHLHGLFRLIFISCNTYSTLNNDERKALLQSVRSHLHPQGIFTVSFPNPRLLRLLPEVAETDVEEIIEHPLDGLPVQISTSWVRGKSLLQIFWHFDHLFPDGKVTRLTIEQAHHLLTVEEYEQEFIEAGFRICERYGDFNQSPFQPSSPYLILVVQINA